jgi:hypothetical protein
MVRTRLIRSAGCILAMSIQFGCSDQGPEECDREVTLDVIVSASVPTFDWIPECSLYSLVVSDAADRIVWAIETPDERNTIQPPVVYGEVPDGTREYPGPAAALQTGFTYTVRVDWIDRSDGRVLVRFGDERAFTP